MGRTVLPLSHALERERQALAKFRRALDAEDRPHFDALFVSAFRQIAAGVSGAFATPMEMLLVAALLECSKRITELEARVEQLLSTPPSP